MFDRVLNMHLSYLSCFAVDVRRIHRNIYICQKTYCSYPFRLEFSSYSEVIHRSTTFMLKKGSQSLKKKTIQFDVFVLSFSTFMLTKKARAIFYTHQTSGACAGVCECDCTHQMNKTDKYVSINE